MIGFKGGLDAQEFACRRNAKTDVLAKAVAAKKRAEAQRRITPEVPGAAASQPVSTKHELSSTSAGDE
jgi:hypothetical protein